MDIDARIEYQTKNLTKKIFNMHVYPGTEISKMMKKKTNKIKK